MDETRENSNAEGSADPEVLNKALEGVDVTRRQALRRVVIGAAYIVPIVASFSVEGLGIKAAYALDCFKEAPSDPSVVSGKRTFVTKVPDGSICPTGTFP